MLLRFNPYFGYFNLKAFLTFLVGGMAAAGAIAAGLPEAAGVYVGLGVTLAIDIGLRRMSRIKENRM